ncbi:hypothetical protein M3Y99_01642300 [Aphelenchoides fujianensis]|nr:hypothetical protein M3Y99_01642300 [Aphelenchoides fujianensis]
MNTGVQQDVSGAVLEMWSTLVKDEAASDCIKSRPSGIHAGNLVQEIVASLKSGDKRQQDAVLAFVFAHPADAQRVAQSAEVAALAAVDEQLATQVKAILAMKKPAV